MGTQWHCDLHSDMWKYMCFEWEGVVYTFVQLPFGCAPACWVFTKLIKVMVAFWRGFGLKILSYIDDGLGGAASEAEAKVFSDLVIDDDESPFIHDSTQLLFTPWCMHGG